MLRGSILNECYRKKYGCDVFKITITAEIIHNTKIKKGLAFISNNDNNGKDNYYDTNNSIILYNC